MKKCELCGRLARMHCESDQANLCWDCDMKVHGANFLVAKHSRTLLCHACQNPTPWLASGHNLSPAVSVCHSCVGNDNNNREAALEESSESEYEEEEDDDEEEVEDAENQVVPWSGDSSPSMAKPVASMDSLSNGEDGGGGVGDGGSGGCGGFGLKRMRENPSFYSDGAEVSSESLWKASSPPLRNIIDEVGCSTYHIGLGRSSNGEGSSSMGSSRLLKQPRLNEFNQSARIQDRDETKSTRSTAIISYLKRLQKDMIDTEGDASAAAIIGICRLSRDQSR